MDAREHETRIGIAGATGMIGSHLLAALGRGAVGLPRRLVAAMDPAALADWLDAAGVGLVVNAVGTTGSVWPPLYTANVAVAGALARGAARAGCACLFLGSARVFDPSRPELRPETDTPDLPGAAAPGLESAATAPPQCRDAYGASKLFGERQTLEALAESGRGYVLRLPMVLALREGDMDGQVATLLLNRAWRGQSARAAVDAFTQAVSIDTVARAVAALHTAALPGGVYHLTCPGYASLYDMMARLFAACGLPAPGRAVCADFEPASPGPRWQLLAPGRLARLVPAEPWELAMDRFARLILEARHG
jgi:dTDP-4-dehydrorhamnose reductase